MRALDRKLMTRFQEATIHYMVDVHYKLSQWEDLALPTDGVLLTDYLGQLLGVRAGDHLLVEVLEGGRPVREVPVAGLVKEYLGVAGYMDLAGLNRLLREGSAISGAYLAVDDRERRAFAPPCNGRGSRLAPTMS